MFTNISWQAYWITIALALTAYYAVVLVIFYSGSIRVVLQQRWTPFLPRPGGTNPKKASSFQPELFERETDFIPENVPSGSDVSDSIQPLLDELRAFFQQAGSSRMVKGEILFSLSRLLRKYPSVSGTPSQFSLDLVICQDCQKYCSIHLEAEEVTALWKE
ncbi:hypothetical protein V9K67_20790 [Paraflavisolibacter sp. H34]|uniref:hypothetical protein n=1 Tax=Huijunlia imazamoxiresistens TaxID=3127457 RepID=UPI00301A2443